jgi:molybdopterin-biosynthesis enzyme MoeA-like protein
MHSMPSSALHPPLHWIGPTHGDITADCVAKAFGVTIDSNPRALAILHEWVETTRAEMNEARLRMTRIPKGADLILNKCQERLASGSATS